MSSNSMNHDSLDLADITPDTSVEPRQLYSEERDDFRRAASAAPATLRGQGASFGRSGSRAGVFSHSASATVLQRMQGSPIGLSQVSALFRFRSRHAMRGADIDACQPTRRLTSLEDFELENEREVAACGFSVQCAILTHVWWSRKKVGQFCEQIQWRTVSCVTFPRACYALPGADGALSATAAVLAAYALPTHCPVMIWSRVLPGGSSGRGQGWGNFLGSTSNGNSAKKISRIMKKSFNGQNLLATAIAHVRGTDLATGVVTCVRLTRIKAMGARQKFCQTARAQLRVSAPNSDCTVLAVTPQPECDPSLLTPHSSLLTPHPHYLSLRGASRALCPSACAMRCL
eukprot:3757138-Rhodomonas_salina.1